MTRSSWQSWSQTSRGSREGFCHGTNIRQPNNASTRSWPSKEHGWMPIISVRTYLSSPVPATAESLEFFCTAKPPSNSTSTWGRAGGSETACETSSRLRYTTHEAFCCIADQVELRLRTNEREDLRGLTTS